jgi:hypothetical protein
MVNGLRQCGVRELHLLLIQFAEMKTVKQSRYRHTPRESRSQQCSTLHLRPTSMARAILQHSVGGQKSRFAAVVLLPTAEERHRAWRRIWYAVNSSPARTAVASDQGIALPS